MFSRIHNYITGMVPLYDYNELKEIIIHYFNKSEPINKPGHIVINME